ncbi:hypothetical protein RND81_07G127100 [Saponaria officinalis]|uniref:Reverse transcriptase domain-containing protein n=1 Tax=Saponaria officinalis TaxID=3572 RepID=A0AAW1JUA2_SAPOF
MGILETRIREVNSATIIRRRFGGLAVFCCYSVHRNGRIWIVWNPRTTTVYPLSIHPQFIHCRILHHGSHSAFHCTFVYAFNDPSARLALWDALVSLSASVQEWVVLGDFNVIRDISERISSSLPNLDDILVFNSCILNCGLTDLQSSGCEFSWTNKQDGIDRVWCKLDREMVNGAWLSKYSSSSAQFLPAGVSDHSPVLVKIMAADAHPRRFSFLNCWVTMPGYHPLVQAKWAIPVSGSSFYKLFARLKNVRYGLTGFHKSSTSGLQGRLSTAKAALDASSMALMGQHSCPTLFQKHKDDLNHYLKLKKAELSMLSQKAKADGIINNDNNTNVFYARIKERHHSQVIGEIIDHQGVLRTGSDQVIEGFISYYQHLLGNSVEVHALDKSVIAADACVSLSEWPSLIKAVSDEEIKAALFSIDPQSSPGADGFSSGFFISSWELVGLDLCRAVREFFRTSHLPKQVNTTLLTLVPKKKVVQSVQDFRPIACCSVLYKIISKVLANRLQPLLPLLVGQEQAAFIKGRNIFDNILLSQHLVKNYTRKFLTPRCLIKVDIRKDFDTLQWSFITDML